MVNLPSRRVGKFRGYKRLPPAKLLELAKAIKITNIPAMWRTTTLETRRRILLGETILQSEEEFFLRRYRECNMTSRGRAVPHFVYEPYRNADHL